MGTPDPHEDRPRRRARRDAAVLAGFILVTVVLGTQIPKIHIDSSTEVFIPANHEIARINERIERVFGSIDPILMGVEVQFGSVMEPEVLALIGSLTASLEADPFVAEVISLTNTDFIEGSLEGMNVIPLLEGYTAADAELLDRRLNDWEEAYVGNIVSRDRGLAVIIVRPAAGAQNEANRRIAEHIAELSEEYRSPNISFPVAGLAVVKNEINRSVMTDIVYLIPIVAVLILGVMLFSFRRWEGVLYPLLSLLTAGIWVVGIMGALGITFTMASLLVPVLLLAIGSAYGIHVMSHFYEDLSHRTGFLGARQVDEVIRGGMGNIRVSVILAGVTTAGGFIAQLTSPLGPFRAFGVLSALGVVFSQVTTLLLIPVLLRLRYRAGIDTARFHSDRSVERRTKTPRVFAALRQLVLTGRRPAALLSLTFLVVTLAVIPRIDVGTDMMRFFSPNSTMVRDTETFNRELNGTGLVSVLIEAPENGAVLDPGFLRTLELFDEYMRRNHPNVRSVETLVPSIKRINRIMNADRVPYEVLEEAAPMDFFGSIGLGDDSDLMAVGFTGEEADPEPSLPPGFETLTYEELAGMFAEALLETGSDRTIGDFLESFFSRTNYNGAAFDEIPTDPAKYGLETRTELRDLIAQYLVLFSGNLDMFIDDGLEPAATIVTVRLDSEERGILVQVKKDIVDFWNHYLPDGWRSSIGGGSSLALVLSELVTRSQYLSLIGALVIVWIIVTIMFRSPVAGLIGLIPVVYALLGIFLFMVIFGFSLDIVTSLLASLAIGVGVDYAIHFMSAYRRAVRAGTADPLAYVYRATGSAIAYNALSVGIGFLGLVISRFIPIRQMGILFSVAMLFACFSSLIVLPMVLEKTNPRFLRKPGVPVPVNILGDVR